LFWGHQKWNKFGRGLASPRFRKLQTEKANNGLLGGEEYPQLIRVWKESGKEIESSNCEEKGAQISSTKIRRPRESS